RQRLAEERRAEVADGRAEVRVVQKVLRVDREGQVVAVLRRVASAEPLAAAPAATPASPVTPPSAAAAATAAATTAGSRRCAAPPGHFAEAEGLTQAHVDREEGGPHPVVARDDLLAGLRVEVERAEGRDAHARTREVCGEGGALRKQCVAVDVAPDGDVEGAARHGRDERT